MARSALIRREPCPKCGSYMLWTEQAWKVRTATAGGGTEVQRSAAYVCENPVCGRVLDPALFPREEAVPPAAATPQP
jgi:hypothetical protein